MATDRVSLVAGVLLVAALTLLPWHSGGPTPTNGGGSGRTAIQAPNAIVGIAAALVAAATVVWVAAATLATRPRVPYPGSALLPLAVTALGLVLLKLVLEPRRLAVGTWAALVLAAVVLGAQLVRYRVSRPL